MIIIYKEIVRKYIKKVSIEDFKMFAKENSISYTPKEIEIVYQFIMNNYEELLNHNEDCLMYLKENISPTLYEKLYVLYQKYYTLYLA